MLVTTKIELSENKLLECKLGLCSKCRKILGLLYRNANSNNEFKFRIDEMNEYEYCPYCSEQLYINKDN